MKIKLKFLGFWSGFNETNNLYINTLQKKFDVELSDNPDYVIASMFCSPFKISEYNECVRIFHSGEDYFPDMNLYDYAVGYNYGSLKGIVRGRIIDRYFRWPFGCEWGLDEVIDGLNGMTEATARDILKSKSLFCNFIYGHESYIGQREALYRAVSEYKKVDSFGAHLNNMDDGRTVSRQNKISSMKDYKFTIAAETLRYPGMATEKIFDAYRAHTIPIYFGDPCIRESFIPETFIEWDGENNSLQSVVEQVIKIDTDDDTYVNMLMKKKMFTNKSIKPTLGRFESWLFDIFELPKEDVIQHIKIGGASQRDCYEGYYRKANIFVDG